MKQTDCERLLQENRQICFRLERLSNRFLAKEGLSGAQANLLLYVLSQGEQGSSLTAMHREFGYSKATLSCILKRLREKGYLRAEGCADDDRLKLLFATEKGKAAAVFLQETLLRVQQLAYDCFSEQELHTLDRLQNKMLQNLCLCADEKENQNQKEDSEA